MSRLIEQLYFSESNGLVRISDSPANDLPVNECQVILDAYSINRKLDFVYFRRFTDRASQPIAFIVDNTTKKITEDELAELHRNLWFYGHVPILYVEWENHVDIVNCFSVKNDLTKKKTWKYTTDDRIDFLNALPDISEQLNRYSMFRLADGTFWEDTNTKKFIDAKNSAHRILIEKVKSADQEINGGENSAARKLLLLSLLIKYLEDRKVFAASKKNWFAQYVDNAKSFLDVLKTYSKEKIIKLFNDLEYKFNGDIFSFPESNKITKKIIKSIIHLGEKNADNTRQLYFWDIYSFEHIPVEVLSHIYQYFLGKDDGTVFTPAPLVDLILDYAMPYDRLTGSEKILDPTCGSGIFLVSAFRRLISVKQRTKQWEKLTPDDLIKLLKNSIFGIELKDEAASVAAFSLALAVCDALRPDVIWNQLRFDKLLWHNILPIDFGKVTRENHPLFIPESGFDIIIGNPPFVSKLTESISDELQKVNAAITDNQLAYYVFFTSIDRFLSNSGLLCMIQPQGFLYNMNTLDYRKKLFTNYTVNTILDFISIGGLFHEANTKIIVLKVCKQIPLASNKINHLTFRRTETAKRQIFFELDYYDYHVVSQPDTLVHDFVWRINLLGGGRLFAVAKRLKELKSIQFFINSMNWETNEGFTVGEKNLKTEDQCKFLFEQELLTEDAFLENSIDRSKLTRVEFKQCTKPRTKEIYASPLMIIAKTDKLYAALWKKGFLAYNHSYFSINRISHGDLDKLRLFFTNFTGQRDVLRACLYLFSHHVLSSQSTAVLKQDIMELPWPQDGKFDMVKWENELLFDVSEYITEYIRVGQESKLLIKDTDQRDLENYSQTFLRLMRKYFQATERSHCLFQNGLILVAFTLSGNKELPWLNDFDWYEKIRKLIDKKHGATLQTKRIVRIMTGNSVILIKPGKLRYWIRSAAIRDADDIIADILHHGKE
jgi:type I restriction-modification system DNA methylase subunit